MNLSNKVYNAQINNYQTFNMYKKQCIALAENVFKIGNIEDDDMIDLAFVNKKLLREGSIAWFVDEVLGLLALPYVNMGVLDLYGRPTKIQVIGENGYKRILQNTAKKKEFIIMFDNNEHISIFNDVVQYADRIAMNVRVRRCQYITATHTPNLENL